MMSSSNPFLMLMMLFSILLINTEYVQSMRQYGVPQSWGYKIHQPRSYIYHQQYLPRPISKSFYESDHYDHQRPLYRSNNFKYKFDDNDDNDDSYFNRNRIIKYQQHHQQHPVLIQKTISMSKKDSKKKKKSDDDSIKINLEFPMKKFFGKENLEKEFMGVGMGGGGGHEKQDGGYEGGQHQQNHGYEEGGGEKHHEEKNSGKDFDIQIPKFDVDGMLDKIKDKI